MDKGYSMNIDTNLNVDLTVTEGGLWSTFRFCSTSYRFISEDKTDLSGLTL